MSTATITVTSVPSNARIFIVSALAGPVTFAFLFCLNAAIGIYFFDPRSDRPMHEYLVMLTLFQFFFFIWALFVSLPAFVALAAWLIALLVLLKKEAVGNNGLILAAAIFSPLMIFITCKLQDRFLGGWQPSTEGEVMPHAVFSTVLIWELPLRGFLLITTLHFAAILVCCWLMLRRHPRTLSNQVT